ncbi:Aspartate/methionine/tyrosine aminotransferase [Arboricoccus pini]|uniref:Aspartate/methionine/tyrosine aminotransferase n=1 Tax=Arboricoccus pini TaxID=1963835 RepID=A0A212R8N9_9PROT|nr:aminotransferase class I/II-fold pyridoxal phosphate-dependent enzyme [Arboricoccus pini]SNB68551.1 Aspartate/methionine/tyrosine aminotransferase [Arboricoccus pini]
MPMKWNDRLDGLNDFPFRRLAQLLAGKTPGAPPFDLSIGEPKHAPPALLATTIAEESANWNRYPPMAGTAAFREAAAGWMIRRFGLPEAALDPERHIVPLAGTKEGLFMLPQIVTPDVSRFGGRPVVLVPNPVYSTYVGAATIAGAEPIYLRADAASGFLPDLDQLEPAVLDRTSACFICTPANPQGAVADLAYLRRLVRLARTHGFLLIVDECYAEIFDREPPASGLNAALAEGGDFSNVVTMHSLSKRSSAPGLRSGFVAGDSEVLSRFLRLRAYGAAVQPMPLMAAATALWRDDAHVESNRLAYRRKFDLAAKRLQGRFDFFRPAGGFFLWLNVAETGLSGEAAALKLWCEAGVKVLPGSYLAVTDTNGINPGRDYLRVALVHEEGMIDAALERIAQTL